VNSDTGQILKTKELAPPILITPANLAPFFYSASNKVVEFSWSPIDNAHSYHVRVSKNPYFTSNVYDNKRLPARWSRERVGGRRTTGCGSRWTNMARNR